MRTPSVSLDNVCTLPTGLKGDIVLLYVDVRMIDAVTDACLSCEVDNDVELINPGRPGG